MAQTDGMMMCREDRIWWMVLPAKDARENWDFKRADSLHLLNGAPHGMETPLAPTTVRGNMLGSPVGNVMMLTVQRVDFEHIPICPQCLFHAYDPELFSMASTRWLQEKDRWEAPWFLTIMRESSVSPRHAEWHVTTFYKPVSSVVHPRTSRDKFMSLEEIVALNGTLPPWVKDMRISEVGVCPECLSKLFPEMVVNSDDQ